MEFTLLGSAAIGVASLYAMLRWEAARGNVLECSRDLWDVALTGIVAGVFVGRLAAMIGDGVNPLTNIADILIIRAGVSTGFAALAALTAVALVARGEAWVVLDGLAAAALAGLAGWHAGCLTREACLGTVTDLPWAMTQPRSTIGRHPVELYAAGLYALAAIGLALYRKRSLPAIGVSAGVGLAAAGAVRLVTEPVRPSLSSGPVLWYVLAMIVGGAVVVWRVRATRTAA